MAFTQQQTAISGGPAMMVLIPVSARAHKEQNRSKPAVCCTMAMQLSNVHMLASSMPSKVQELSLGCSVLLPASLPCVFPLRVLQGAQSTTTSPRQSPRLPAFRQSVTLCCSKKATMYCGTLSAGQSWAPILNTHSVMLAALYTRLVWCSGFSS